MWVYLKEKKQCVQEKEAENLLVLLLWYSWT